MEMALHAIETTATLDENGQLILDELLTIALPRKVLIGSSETRKSINRGSKFLMASSMAVVMRTCSL